MKLKHLEISSFRNHTSTTVECSDCVNGLIGENGQGKTNLLEGISYLCLTKSFFGASDSTVLQIGKNRFAVSGEFVGDSGVRYDVGVRYDAEAKEKEVSVNRAAIDRSADIIGQFPVVVLSPESNAITAGAPAERRKFMDFVIAQSSRVYLEDLVEYRRVVKQRNRILLDVKMARTDPSELLDPWNTELIDRGARIMVRRRAFLAEFQPLVQEAYEKLAGEGEEPTAHYKASVEHEESTSEEELRRLFRQELERRREEEMQTATSSVGPHRDELELKMHGLDLRRYASQGQHKSLLIALKVAEFFYLQKARSESPLLLLDDIFGELDACRSERLLGLIHSLGQAFITSTNEAVFPADFDWGTRSRKFFVQQGAVV